MIGNMVPPAFAKQLCLAACREVANITLEREFNQSARRVETHAADASTKPLVGAAPRSDEAASHGEPAQRDLGPHGKWEFHPQWGWKHSNSPHSWEDMEKLVKSEPWQKVPSSPELSVPAPHRRGGCEPAGPLPRRWRWAAVSASASGRDLARRRLAASSRVAIRYSRPLGFLLDGELENVESCPNVCLRDTRRYSVLPACIPPLLERTTSWCLQRFELSVRAA